MTDTRGNGKDIARQVLTVLFAITQAGIGAFRTNVGDISDEFTSPIVPANYAFAIWGVIFLLLFIYAIYQVLPAQRTNPLFRSMGWWLAAAMAGNTLWTYTFTDRQFIVSQVLIFAIAACAIMALLRYVQHFATTAPDGIEKWVVGPGTGLLAGWVTAASFVGLSATLITEGWERSGQGADIGGSALLLFAGGVAALVLSRVARGPVTAWLPYGIAVLWALVAVVVNWLNEAQFVPIVAGLIAIIVIVLLGLVWREPRASSAPAAA